MSGYDAAGILRLDAAPCLAGAAERTRLLKACQRADVGTAAALFDGHDAALNIMRRILMSLGAEVIHLGHNRSVDEIVTAALQEDAQGIAISSYQGGHVEYFKYTIDLLKARCGEHIQVFGGGGGVIVPVEIRQLLDYGVACIYGPERLSRHTEWGAAARAACQIDTVAAPVLPCRRSTAARRPSGQPDRPIARRQRRKRPSGNAPSSNPGQDDCARPSRRPARCRAQRLSGHLPPVQSEATAGAMRRAGTTLARPARAPDAAPRLDPRRRRDRR